LASDITELVHAAGAGDQAALKQLFATVYEEIKRLARRQLSASPQPTLNTTGLVHEAYLKLVQPDSLKLRDRSHFFAIAAKAMRQIVIDHARRRQADKRGGPAAQIATLSEISSDDALDPETLTRLDSALTELQAMEPRLAELVEMRFFAGLSVVQVAELRDVATRTVLRDWRRARAYLFGAVRQTAS
jgi:RNA polymerase sigma factor (TIGR02999 family)